MAGKLANLSTVENATVYSDCDAALPDPNIVSNAGSAACYGPTLTYTGHPDDSARSGQLPSGDLGLWLSSNEGGTEACAASKVNSLVGGVADKVDLALGAQAMMICAARIAGKSIPASGSSVDLTSTINDNNVTTKITVTSATLAVSTNSTGDTVYSSAVKGSFTKAGVSESFSMTLKHVPTSTTAGSGLVTFEQEGLTDSGQSGACGSTKQNHATSVAYSNTAAGVTYRMAHAMFSSSNTDYYETDGQLKSKPGSGANGSELTNGWCANYNVMIAEMDTSGYGKLAYSWIAGHGDDHTRTFNIETKSDGTGNAYFGFAANPDSSGAYGPLTIDKMICNWAGPSNSHTGVSKVQKQVLSYNSTSKEWQSGTDYLSYAPTNNCDWTTNASATFVSGQAGGTQTTLSYPLNNALYDLTSYKTEFTVPTAPTVP